MILMRRDLSLSKENWLWFLSNKLGFDVEICYNYRKKDIVLYSKWVSYLWLQHFDQDEFIKDLRCTRKEFIKRASHRSVLDIELVIDIDEPGECNTIKEKAQKLVSKLKEKGIIHTIYFSGNKSYHISILIPDLRNFSDYHRTKFKRDILSSLGADTQKASSRNMISFEGEPHRTSGKYKIEVTL